MKKLLMLLTVVTGVFAGIPAKADGGVLEGMIVGATVGTLAQKHLNDEPHWSLRDGCKPQDVKAANGPYVYTSYDHCKSLPRVYNGKAWKPKHGGTETLPST